MSHDWLRFLDARSDLSKSDVHTELLLHHFPLHSSAPKLETGRDKVLKSRAPLFEPETNLSVSIEMSIPYYNMSDYRESFDTVDLLQNRSDDTHGTRATVQGTPKSTTFANTSHISPKLRGNSTIEAANAHQVPMRFSRFIMEQNNLGSGTGQASSIIRRSRDISELMGSQATIFSTRFEELGPAKRISLRSRSKRSKQESSRVHSLTRQKAIRSKDGILAYRMKVRMKKIFAKIKAKLAPIFHYVSRSKKATSNARMPQTKKSRRGLIHRSRSRRLTPLAISVPVTNPELGRGIKSDSQNHQQVSLDPGRTENDNKWTHMLRFLTEQQRLASTSQAAFLVDSAAPTPPPHAKSLLGPKHYLNSELAEAQKEKEAVQTLWKTYLSGVLAQRIKLRQEIALFQMLLANQTIPPALSKHIADVASHKASIVGSSPDPEVLKAQRTLSGENRMLSGDKRVFSGRSNVESLVSVSDDLALDDDMSLPLIESDIESEAETLDLNVAKLQHVLNRRSMLGEMLDYESDYLSLGGSVGLSNVQIGPLSRYGTVKRQLKSESSSHYSLDPSVKEQNLQTTTSSRYSSDELTAAGLVTLGIPRSHGYNVDLNLAVS